MNNLQEPQLCPECGKLDLWPATISRECQVKHDGTRHSFVVPELNVLKCRACGEVLFDGVTNEQISQGLRSHLGLLSPQEIREKLKSLGMNQRTFAERTGIAEETISRWLSGAYIQGRVYDNYMRLFFATEEAKPRVEEPVR